MKAGTMDMEAPRVRYRIDDLVLDVAARRVSRSGKDLGITGLTFELLLALGKAAPALLSSNDIFAQVWPNQDVSNETLTQRIKLLRQQLSDNVEKPRYVASCRGHGYRLLASMTALPAINANPGGNATAHALYMQARTVARGTIASTDKALGMIDEALSHNPEHPAARGYRAFLLAGSVGLSGKPPAQLVVAGQEAMLALSLDAQLPDAHIALGMVAAQQYRWREAELHFHQALELAPTIPFFHNLYVLSVLRPLGKLGEARQVLEKIYELNPADGFTAHELAMTLHLLDEDNDALRFIGLAQDLSGIVAPHWDLLLIKARVLSRRGTYAAAVSYAIDAMPELLLSAGAEGVLRCFYSALAQEAPVAAALAALQAFLPALEDLTIDRRTRTFFIIACIELGDHDAAFTLLEHFRKQPEAVRPSIELADFWLKELQQFRSDKRFGKMVKNLGLPPQPTIHVHYAFAPRNSKGLQC